MLSYISYYGLFLNTEYGDTSSADLLLTSMPYLDIYPLIYPILTLCSELEFLDEFINPLTLNEFTLPVFIYPTGSVFY
jgi:hypothetical protein